MSVLGSNHGNDFEDYEKDDWDGMSPSFCYTMSFQKILMMRMARDGMKA